MCDCKPNPGYLVLAWIFASIGIWSLVGGFVTQLTSVNPVGFTLQNLFWYFLGTLLLGIAKMLKKKCTCCHMH